MVIDRGLFCDDQEIFFFGQFLEPNEEAFDVVELRLVLHHGFDFDVPGLTRIYRKINL